MVVVAAGVAVVLLLAAAAFQFALTAGAPLGEATMGGRARTTNGVLAPPFRVAALVNGAVLVGAAWVLALRGGLLGSRLLSEGSVRWAPWAIAAFMLVNTAGNLAGRHPLERWVMGPATLLVGALALIVALNA